MAIIYDSNNLNLLALNTPGVYVRIIRPPGYILGQPTDAAAILGTASWGALNTPYLSGSPSDTALAYGGSSVVGSSDPFDLCNESNIAFAQAQSPVSQQQWLVRISDGTDAKSSVILMDIAGSPVAILTLTALYSGIVGNQIKVHITNGAALSSYNVTLVPPSPLDVEVFPNILGGSAGVFANNLLNAINQGVSGFRGPSKLVKASAAGGTSVNPTLVGSPFSMAGGTDGRSTVDVASFMGSDGAVPKTGIYSLRNLQPVPTVMWCAGLTDPTAVPTIQSFVRSEGMMAAFTLPAGTSTATASSTRTTLGIDDPLCFFTKDWVYHFDSTPGVGRVKLVSPTPFIAGRIAALSPENSPCNKELFEVLGTERLNDQTGYRSYSASEIGQCHDNGIMIAHNPIPAGSMWGMPHGNAATTDGVRARIEWARMTNFLAHSINGYMGRFVGMNQSQRTNDPLRAQVKAALDEFLQNLADNLQIDSFKVVCDKSNNSDAMIARGFLKAQVYVRYMSSVQYLIIDLQGGTTVITVQNTLQDGLAA